MRLLSGLFLFLTIAVIAAGETGTTPEASLWLPLGQALMRFTGVNSVAPAVAGVFGPQVAEAAIHVLAWPAAAVFAGLSVGCLAVALALGYRPQLFASARRRQAAAPHMRAKPATLLAGALGVGASDREFLPASLEILVTPPSPVTTSLMLSICGVFLACVVWSYFGWLDIYAVAPGKIQPSGRSKIVQPLEPGKIVAIHVDNGSIVEAGDLLLELDPTETGADRNAQARELETSSAEAARRAAAISVARARSDDLSPVPVTFDAAVGEAARRSEEGALAADLAQLRSSIASLHAQIDEKHATLNRLKLGIEARQRLMDLAKERVEMREEVQSQGAGSRALIVDALQTYETLRVSDAADHGQLLESGAAAASLERKIDETISNFIADQTQKQLEADRKRTRLEQELVKAQSKSDHTQLRAPIAGTVQQLAVTTVGQVVTSGQSLLTVVPLDGPIEIEAMIANQDIGFVRLGQNAVVKVEAFPFTRYGTLEGRVVKISRDGVEVNANGAEIPPGARGSNGPSPNGPGAANLVFPATLSLSRRSMMIDGADVALTAGMAVTLEIKTGQRRAIDYVLSPLSELANQAAHER